MRNGVIASLLVVAIVIGAGVGYLRGSSNLRTITSVSTSATTIVTAATTTAVTTNTALVTSSLTVTYTVTQRTTLTSLIEPTSGPLVILGASISHSLPVGGTGFTVSKSLNSSSYVAIENNGTGTVTFTQLVLFLKCGNGAYTGAFNSPPYALEPKTPLYLEMTSLPTATYQGEPFTVSVSIGQNSTQPFTNAFY